MRTPAWYARAAGLLASGATIVATAKQLDIAERTLRRHLGAPSGLLRSQVEAARVEKAQADADDLGNLKGKALAVLEKALDAGDLGAAKALLGKLVATPADAPAAQETQPEPSVEDALRELALALPCAADLIRMNLGQVPPEVVEALKAACRAFLADDLQPRPPLDVEAERVQGVAPEPEPAPAAQPKPAGRLLN